MKNRTKIHISAELMADMLFAGRTAYGQPDLNVIGASFEGLMGDVVLDIEGDDVPADAPECQLRYRTERKLGVGGTQLSIALFDGLHARPHS